MAQVEFAEPKFKSPVHKLVSFFQRSRNNWKNKYKAVKGDLRREQNQRRAVEKSRAQWRERAEDLRQQVRRLHQELADQKPQ